MIKTLKTHASLRGTNVVSDEAIQLRELTLAQSTNVELLTCKRYAFTMAEILLSLTIIGVVAAITLPSLMANINERTWNTQRKALYARMSQAIAMMPQVGGYGTLTEEGGSITEDTAAEVFLTEGLSKVLKINNICDSEHLADCGVSTSYSNLSGNVKSFPKSIKELNSVFVGFYKWTAWGEFSYSQPDTKAVAFETFNGETIVLYYNPGCTGSITSDVEYYPQSKMCANFIYDLNGNKGPNTVGKDIGFITALYNTDTDIVAPMPLSTDAASGEPIAQTAAGVACIAQDSSSRLPNREEASAMFYNRELVGLPNEDKLWTSSLVAPNMAWRQELGTSDMKPDPRGYRYNVRCVKR